MVRSYKRRKLNSALVAVFAIGLVVYERLTKIGERPEACIR